jgi:hypothetical protein
MPDGTEVEYVGTSCASHGLPQVHLYDGPVSAVRWIGQAAWHTDLGRGLLLAAVLWVLVTLYAIASQRQRQSQR